MTSARNRSPAACRIKHARPWPRPVVHSRAERSGIVACPAGVPIRVIRSVQEATPAIPSAAANATANVCGTSNATRHARTLISVCAWIRAGPVVRLIPAIRYAGGTHAYARPATPCVQAVRAVNAIHAEPLALAPCATPCVEEIPVFRNVVERSAGRSVDGICAIPNAVESAIRYAATMTRATRRAEASAGPAASLMVVVSTAWTLSTVPSWAVPCSRRT